MEHSDAFLSRLFRVYFLKSVGSGLKLSFRVGYANTTIVSGLEKKFPQRLLDFVAHLTGMMDSLNSWASELNDLRN